MADIDGPTENSVERERSFLVRQRSLRGYGPLAVLAVLILLEVEGGPGDQLHARHSPAKLFKLLSNSRGAVKLRHSPGGRSVWHSVERIQDEKLTHLTLELRRHHLNQAPESFRKAP